MVDNCTIICDNTDCKLFAQITGSGVVANLELGERRTMEGWGQYGRLGAVPPENFFQKINLEIAYFFFIFTRATLC